MGYAQLREADLVLPKLHPVSTKFDPLWSKVISSYSICLTEEMVNFFWKKKASSETSITCYIWCLEFSKKLLVCTDTRAL